MPIKAKIQNDLKAALKNKDSLLVSVLRLLLSEVHNLEIQKRKELSEEDILNVLGQSAKKHKDSLAQFRRGDREDLAGKEEAELKIIESYLPPALAEAELQELVRAAVAFAKMQNPSQQNMGAVMKILKPKITGRASGHIVSEMVKKELNPRS